MHPLRGSFFSKRGRERDEQARAWFEPGRTHADVMPRADKHGSWGSREGASSTEEKRDSPAEERARKHGKKDRARRGKEIGPPRLTWDRSARGGLGKVDAIHKPIRWKKRGGIPPLVDASGVSLHA